MTTGKTPFWTPTTPKRHHLVLVGGGHTHVQVLRHMIMHSSDPNWSQPKLDVTLVVDNPVAMYSGMVPGFVAGQYQQSELEIDVVPLAQLAGARVILSRANGVQPREKTVLVEGRSPVSYDLLSIDIGSTVVGLDLPGVAEHALASRPITRLVEQTEEEMKAGIDLARRASRPPTLLVVGAGAGGVELAFTLRQRVLLATGLTPQVTLVHAGSEILPGSPRSLVRRVRRAAQQRGIEILTQTRVKSIQVKSIQQEPGAGRLHRSRIVALQGGNTIEADTVVWVAGAVAHRNFDPGSLPTNHLGFLSTRPTLQVQGFDDIFAVGDCATLLHQPTPKAGVFAVRQGPVLIDNLERSLTNRPLKRYKPQRDFLALLNLGDGTAVGSKKGFSFEGRWVMGLKDRIDRKFMKKFQVLQHTAAYTPAFATLTAQMGMSSNSDDSSPEMVCGGCAAKLEPDALHAALARVRVAGSSKGADSPVVLGLDRPDDVAAWRTSSGELTVRSVDVFRAFANDPWLVGRVAAQNALSDLQAKGTRPRFALSMIGLPQDLSPTEAEELLFQVLSGAQRTLQEHQVELLGGHTTTGQELWVGFSVDGSEAAATEKAEATAPLLLATTAQVGDRLILTKPLGTGVLFHAHMSGRLSGNDYRTLIDTTMQSNGPSGKLARSLGASAATDVTGFGLAGHLIEMLDGAAVGTTSYNTRLAASLELDSLPMLPGVQNCLEAGLRSTAH